jgi:L,D-transpeptidase ErfK/SrfK
MRVSHGCVRLYPEDIASLYPEVVPGTPVVIVNQPYLVGWDRGGLFLEAHAPLEEQRSRWQGSLEPLYEVVAAAAGERVGEVDWERAEALARNPMGIPVPILRGTPDLGRLLASAPRVLNPPAASDRVAPTGPHVELAGETPPVGFEPATSPSIDLCDLAPTVCQRIRRSRWP